MANPIASLVLAGVLVGDAFTLPRDWDSTLAASVMEALFFVRPLRCHMPSFVYVARLPDGMRVIDEDAESWDVLASYLDDGQTPVVICDLVNRTARSGAWSHVRETKFIGIRVYPLSGEWSAGELRGAREVLFSEQTRALPCWRWVQHYEGVADADEWSTRLLWGGVAHDGLALMTFVGLLYSFTGWPAWFAAHPLSRLSRRLARGLCPSCGYDLRGLDSGVCPECGPSEPRA